MNEGESRSEGGLRASNVAAVISSRLSNTLGTFLYAWLGGSGGWVDERGASGSVEISTEHDTFRFLTGKSFQCVVYRKTGRGTAIDNVEGRCRPFVLVPVGRVVCVE